jgi:hypothetical protein
MPHPSHPLTTFLTGWAASVAYLTGVTVSPVSACDLCAVYRAADARGEYSAGFTFSVAEQFIPFRTEQFNGERFHRPDPEYLDRSMTHVVVGWNPLENLGFSANLPIAHLRYRFNQIEDGFNPVLVQRNETGLGDLALVGRWQVFNQSNMRAGAVLNVLAGVKLPTGDANALDRQATSIDRYESVVGPGHDHDALGPVLSGIHLHDLAMGSGSVDGIFGLAGQFRWRRAFLNHQWQYYLRTEGAGHYRFADEFIGSGGPGAFLWLSKRGTLSLQFNTVYDTRGSDEFRGRPSVHTGLTAWYAGPQVVFTWGSNLSSVFSLDLPLRITGRGFQNVPDYRLNASVNWRL